MRRTKFSPLPGVLLAVGMLLALAVPCQAREAVQATELTQDVAITLTGAHESVALLQDGKEQTKVQFQNGGEIILTSGQKVAALYLIWDAAPPKSWRINTPNGQASMGKSRYLHQYSILPVPQTTTRITFQGPATLCELRLFTKGVPPPDVQDWAAPLEKADLLLLPTHADDEHIYFGGTMPTYTARDKAVQVAYMVNHHREPYRPHELLNGLWTVGIRNYPIIPAFEDQYSGSLEHAKTLYDPEKVLAYQVALIRRFRPEVIVGHDINGEYGHGAHCLNAATLQKAVVAAADEHLFPPSAKEYGGWDTKKTYLHLWPERALVMNWNVPLAQFGGATAFEMAVKGFDQHSSQRKYFEVEQRGPYDCRKFGLYRSTVGDDLEKNDFFENIT